MIDLCHVSPNLWPFNNVTISEPNPQASGVQVTPSRNKREGSVVTRHWNARMRKLMSRKRYKSLHYTGRVQVVKQEYGTTHSKFRKNECNCGVNHE